MRSLICQCQRVVRTNTALDYLSVDPDFNTLYGSYNNEIVNINIENKEVALHHVLDDVEAKISDIHWLPSHRALFLVMNATTLALFHPSNTTLEEVAVIDEGVSCAEWAPDDGICVIVTEAGNLMLMSEEFDCIKSVNAKPEDFGAEHQTQVGWGSKETQFHGSEGKSASKQPVFSTPTPVSTSDTLETRISWRGDGQYFAVSTVDQRDGNEYRVIRMWTREGVHVSTNEPSPGLEDSLSWRPSGNLITCTAYHNDKHQVVFMERNGLRHGEFPLTFSAPNTAVSNTSWNCSSNILAVVYEGEKQCHVMLYTSSNYTWQLKQHYKYDSSSITFMWDPLDENRFHLALSDLYICYQLTDKVLTCSNSTTLVINNNQVNTTPMSTMCIPPPMSYSQLVTVSASSSHSGIGDEVSSPACNSVTCHGDDSWVICNDRTFQRFNNVSYTPPGEISPDEVYSLETEFHLESYAELRHTIMLSPTKAYCVTLVNDVDSILTLELSDKEVFVASCMTLEENSAVANMIRHPESGTVVVQMMSGELFELNDGMLEPWGNEAMRECSVFSEMLLAVFNEEMVVIGRTNNNHLFMDTRLWSYDCTSFSLHKTHLLLTSNSHTLTCVNLNQPSRVARNTEGVVDTGIRTLERGSRLVISDPNTSRVILQMPRGNLELIHPRPLLLTYLAKLIDNIQYGKVFEAVRKHRVNMNFIFDYHPEQFLAKLSDVLKEASAQHMELFIAELSDEDTTLAMYSFMVAQSPPPASKVKTVCAAVTDAIMTSENSILWLNTITSCYVKTEEFTTGLSQLKSRHSSHPNEVEAAIKYMLVLTDDEALFNHSLGTYDLDLVLLVAQHTQKDPKEYMQILTELGALDEDYRKFRIDQHLGRYTLALQSLVTCADRFGEVCEFVAKHSLHSAALGHYSFGSDEYNTIGKSFAELLRGKGCLEEAGVLFGQCGDLAQCLACLRLTSQSNLALAVAAQVGLTPDQTSALAEQLAENLKRDNNYREAGRLYNTYCDNADEAVEALCEGGLYSVALEVSQTRKRVDLIPNIMTSLKVEAESTLSLLVEKRELVEKLCARIVIVREKRSRIGEDDMEEMEHSDLFSDTTSHTATSHTSSSSRRSAKSAKGRKKQEMKKYSLKEGSKYEYFAIQEAYKGVMTFLNLKEIPIRDMVNIMLLQGLRKEAEQVAAAQRGLVDMVNRNVEVIWPPAKSFVVAGDLEESGIEEEVEPVSHPPDKCKLGSLNLHQFAV